MGDKKYLVIDLDSTFFNKIVNLVSIDKHVFYRVVTTDGIIGFFEKQQLNEI